MRGWTGVAFLTMALGAAWVEAQNKAPQVHGYAAQGFLYSTGEDYLWTQSSKGTPDWTEVAVSVSERPTAKLRIGAQAHWFRLGGLEHRVLLDWGLVDYKVNEYFGVRAGQVKTALGLFNDAQDVDSVYLWSMLPQATYPVDNRSYYLSHLGGEAYGSVAVGEKGGKMSYRAYGGRNALDKNIGYTQQLAAESGLVFDKKPAGPMWGLDLRWRSPVPGLLVGVSLYDQKIIAPAKNGSAHLNTVMPVYYAQWDWRKFYLAGEYRRLPVHVRINLDGIGSFPLGTDFRLLYGMAAYRPTSKLQVGTYFSHLLYADQNPDPTNYQNDFVLSGRYDLKHDVYAKVEEHFVHGLAQGYYPNDPTGRSTRNEILEARLGFTF